MRFKDRVDADSELCAMATTKPGNEQDTGPDLKEKLARLRQPAAYPRRPGHIDVLETQMSLLYLTRHHVYKMKKPVFTPYVDFRTVQARRHNCLEEVRLNRRLAEGVYHGAVPLAITESGEMQLTAEGSIVDWLVKMRRLPAERMLDRLIDDDLLTPADVAGLGNVLTHFYRARPPAALGAGEYLGMMEDELKTDRQALSGAPHGFADLSRSVLQALGSFLVEERDLLAERVAKERIIEGHGDLRPEHICMEPLPVIFDCLVFDYRLRLIDPIDELAFLSMSCAGLGAAWVEDPLFESYSAGSGDVVPPRLIAFYKCYRACRWARLACWRLAENDTETWRRRVDTYLRLAVRYGAELA